MSEDNGAGVSPGFRVTTYDLAAGAFTRTTYDLTLNQNLVANYFVLVKGAVNVANAAPSNTGVRITHDPWGTGDLDASSANVIRLTRTASAQGDWVGTITVWECLTDTANAGFRLVDVKAIGCASTNTGSEQTTNATPTAWAALSRVALYGAWGGGGGTSPSNGTNHQPVFAAPSTRRRRFPGLRARARSAAPRGRSSRASLACYSTREDLDRLADGIVRAKQLHRA